MALEFTAYNKTKYLNKTNLLPKAIICKQELKY